MFELKVTGTSGLMLWLGSNDQVQVPMRLSERVACRQALLDALTLLDQTEISMSKFSTANALCRSWQQSSPRPVESRAVCDLPPPSTQ